MESTTIIGPIREAILKALNQLEEHEKLKNLKENSRRFAVRSSAVGEDSEETSAAGQNSTFLGIQDAENILKYIAHCWASLYTYQSVEYRFANSHFQFRKIGFVGFFIFILNFGLTLFQ